MDRTLIVFSGYNQRAVIAFLRTVSRYRNIRYGVIACTNDDTILKTEYKSKVTFIRKIQALDLAEIMEAIKVTRDKCGGESAVIAPTSEGLNRFCLAHRSLLEEAGCILPLVDKDLYALISDKYSFGELCKKSRLKVPKEINNAGIAIPCVAKPKTYFSNKGAVYNPIIITTDEELLNFLENYDVKDFYYQQYLEGESYYLLYYFGKNGNVTTFSQKNLLQQPSGNSILAAKPSIIHSEPIAKAYAKMLLELGFFGLIMIELRKCGGEWYMIEANPRFWGPSQLFINAGVNLFESFLDDWEMINKCEVKQFNPRAKYLWRGGMISTLNNGQEIVELSDISYKDVIENKEWLKYDVYNSSDTLELYRMNE